ncbi:hypothetical protein ACWGPT_06940 [Pseudorhizobium sp. NPDC055634]
MSALVDSDVPKIRQMLSSHMLVTEIAQSLEVSVNVLAAFMRRRNISVAADGNVPPPDLTRPDRTVVWSRRIDPVSGSPRIVKVSLPAITAHRRSLSEQWRITP